MGLYGMGPARESGMDHIICKYTVNLKNFTRILFTQNFAYAKFHENKILAKWQNHYAIY